MLLFGIAVLEELPSITFPPELLESGEAEDRSEACSGTVVMLWFEVGGRRGLTKMVGAAGEGGAWDCSSLVGEGSGDEGTGKLWPAINVGRGATDSSERLADAFPSCSSAGLFACPRFFCRFQKAKANAKRRIITAPPRAPPIIAPILVLPPGGPYGVGVGVGGSLAIPWPPPPVSTSSLIGTSGALGHNMNQSKNLAREEAKSPEGEQSEHCTLDWTRSSSDRSTTSSIPSRCERWGDPIHESAIVDCRDETIPNSVVIHGSSGEHQPIYR